jgi:hypothetical protein
MSVSKSRNLFPSNGVDLADLLPPALQRLWRLSAASRNRFTFAMVPLALSSVPHRTNAIDLDPRQHVHGGWPIRVRRPQMHQE